jgi:rhodanese-related sulfurtransferase
MDQLPARLDDLDPDEDLYVICRTGGRSFRAAQWLVARATRR